MKKFYRRITAVLALGLLLSLSGCGSSDGKTHLTFQIWDVYQRPGMQAMCDAYTAQHPDVVIEVQATSWNEYWTKLEAAAESNTMPDIFWMHTNQLLYYADFGMLADVTDLYDMEYVTQTTKTMLDGRWLVSGNNCVPMSSILEMMTTKQRFKKTDSRQFYHFVQLFSKDDDLTPVVAGQKMIRSKQEKLANKVVAIPTKVWYVVWLQGGEPHGKETHQRRR